MYITVEKARSMYHEHDSAHGFDHVLRVFRTATQIARLEGADLAIVQTAALLHDVGRAAEQRSGVDHAEESARIAREVLPPLPDELLDRIAAAIEQHRFRGTRGPEALEAQVLFDADKLDAIGAVGVARAYAVCGQLNQRLWAEVDDAYASRKASSGTADMRNSAVHTPVHEFRFKLAKLRERMFTESGRRMALERHEYMVGFFERLAQEVRGEV